MVLEALDEIACMNDESSGCMIEDNELDEFSGAGGVAGYTLPLGMRPTGPRRNMKSVAKRSFGGSSKKR